MDNVAGKKCSENLLMWGWAYYSDGAVDCGVCVYGLWGN